MVAFGLSPVDNPFTSVLNLNEVVLATIAANFGHAVVPSLAKICPAPPPKMLVGTAVRGTKVSQSKIQSAKLLCVGHREHFAPKIRLLEL